MRTSPRPSEELERMRVRAAAEIEAEKAAGHRRASRPRSPTWPSRGRGRVVGESMTDDRAATPRGRVPAQRPAIGGSRRTDGPSRSRRPPLRGGRLPGRRCATARVDGVARRARRRGRRSSAARACAGVPWPTRPSRSRPRPRPSADCCGPRSRRRRPEPRPAPAPARPDRATCRASARSSAACSTPTAGRRQATVTSAVAAHRRTRYRR